MEIPIEQKIQWPLEEHLADQQQQMITEHFNRAQEEHEDRIMQELVAMGFDYSTEAEWLHFFKERCILEHHPDDLSILRVDGVMRLKWSDKVELEYSPGQLTIKGSMIRRYEPICIS